MTPKYLMTRNERLENKNEWNEFTKLYIIIKTHFFCLYKNLIEIAIYFFKNFKI